MRLTPSPRLRLVRAIRLQRRLRSKLSRKLMCVAIVVSLVSIPTPGLAHGVNLVSSLTVDVTIGSVRVVSWLFSLLFAGQEVSPDTLEDRVAQVRSIGISPSRFVGYIGDTMTFQAVGRNFAGQTVQGVLFDDWESFNSLAVEVDNLGIARFVGAGLTTITCRVGTAVGVARVLVRPGMRPRQTDQQWKQDQDALPEPASGTVGNLLPSMLDKLVTTAYAQGGGYSAPDFGYNELLVLSSLNDPNSKFEEGFAILKKEQLLTGHATIH